MAKLQLLDKVDDINMLRGVVNDRVVGAYRLDMAYGGYRLVQIVNKSGGETDISPRLKASEMREFLDGFFKGYIQNTNDSTDRLLGKIKDK
tara:strand:+ start:2009 stop:2281 length:273 start_codon:yes stop_codon:yes gene_type:complete